jgi:hypothetical protein
MSCGKFIVCGSYVKQVWTPLSYTVHYYCFGDFLRYTYNSEVPDNRHYRTTLCPYYSVHPRVYSTPVRMCTSALHLTINGHSRPRASFWTRGAVCPLPSVTVFVNCTYLHTATLPTTCTISHLYSTHQAAVRPGLELTAPYALSSSAFAIGTAESPDGRKLNRRQT